MSRVLKPEMFVRDGASAFNGSSRKLFLLAVAIWLVLAFPAERLAQYRITIVYNPPQYRVEAILSTWVLRFKRCLFRSLCGLSADA